MKTIIVGHGPSILTQALGKQIDEFDKVIRLKRCWETLKYPKIYGSRTDVVCGSWTIGPQLKGVGSPEYWIFLDSRHKEVSDDQIAQMKLAFAPSDLLIDRELCDHWNKVYFDNREDYPIEHMTERKKTSDEKGHWHMSAGLHAIMYAMEYLKPDELVLAGFDNLLSGKQETWSITRGPDWKHYPDHNWKSEQKVLGLMAEYYNQAVTCL